MSWVLANQESGQILQSPSPSATALLNSATIIWSSVLSASSYSVYLTPNGSSEYFVETTSGTSVSVSGLSANSDYTSRVVATIISTTTGSISFQTLNDVIITYHKSNLMQMMYSNGMLNSVGSDPAEGPIPPEGRTWSGSIPGSMVIPYTAPGANWSLSRAAHKIYGIQFKFSNLHNYPISGGRMVVGGFGAATYEGVLLPLVGNVTATNPTSGWTTVTINGDPNLPIRASTETSLGSEWSDMVLIPGGVDAGSIAKHYTFPWRFFRPQSSASDYALTWGTWGASDVNRQGVVNGIFSKYVVDHQPINGYLYKYYYAEGDGVTNVSAIEISAFQAHQSPNALSKYGPPGPTSFPFDAVRYLTDIGVSATPIDQILGIGDSITEGYKDFNSTVSCQGVFGRNLRQQYLSATDRTTNYINLGQSGFRVREYLARARGYINADPSSISVAAVSVYTPNIVSGASFSNAWSPEVLLDNKNALIEFESECVANSIVYIPVFWCMSPLGASSAAALTMSAHIDDLKSLWPWLINASTVIQSSAISIGPMSDVYWCADATHPYGPDPYSYDPDRSGYERLRQKFNQDLPTSLALAKAHYNMI